jgi:hypothetical protein
MLDDACESGIEAHAWEQAPMPSLDWAGRRRTIFVRQVTGLVIGIALFERGESLELFEFVEVKFRLV